VTESAFTREADRDLIDIYLFGLERYGLRQAEHYSETLNAKIQMAAENPSFGSDYGDVRSGLRRYESVAHAIYYRPTATGILVLRILYGSMDPARHL